MKRVIRTADAPAAIGPYSQAVEAGGWIFLSGQIPLDPRTGGIVKGDIRIQTRQVLENIKSILIAAGASMANVVKTTVFLKDMNDFAVMNEVYGQYFTVNPPARACVEVSRLPRDVLIEVEAVAKL